MVLSDLASQLNTRSMDPPNAQRLKTAVELDRLEIAVEALDAASVLGSGTQQSIQPLYRPTHAGAAFFDQVFLKYYSQTGTLTFKICISRGSQASWGPLFIVAIPSTGP